MADGSACDDPVVDREQLRRILATAEGEAVPTFLAALDDPRTSVHPDSEKHTNSTANLLTIYGRRADHVRETGLPTLGLDESVARLRTTAYPDLTLGLATAHGGYPWCVAFLAPDLSEVVAAIVVHGPSGLIPVRPPGSPG